MQSEEAVLDLPAVEERLTLFEDPGDPGITDVGVERLKHIIDHPEDGLPALGLAEMITLGCVVHLVDSQVA
jgi:hypothetical protein